MAEKTFVEFIEEWQTGFFLVLGTGFVAFCVGILVASVSSPAGGLAGVLGGAVLAFAAFSYLLYGR